MSRPLPPKIRGESAVQQRHNARETRRPVPLKNNLPPLARVSKQLTHPSAPTMIMTHARAREMWFHCARGNPRGWRMMTAISGPSAHGRLAVINVLIIGAIKVGRRLFSCVHRGNVTDMYCWDFVARWYGFEERIGFSVYLYLQFIYNWHPTLSLRVSAATCIARATSFNKKNVKKLSKNLAADIYNIRETSITTAHRLNCVIDRKGYK